jgi:hypothetical protein
MSALSSFRSSLVASSRQRIFSQTLTPLRTNSVRDIGWLLAPPPKKGTPRAKKIFRVKAVLTTLMCSVIVGYSKIEVIIYDDEGHFAPKARWSEITDRILDAEAKKVEDIKKRLKESEEREYQK